MGAPSLKLPVLGDLLPDNPLLFCNKKLSGEIDASGRFSFETRNATIKILNGLLTLKNASAWIDNKGLGLRGKWLGETILFKVRTGPPFEITGETYRRSKVEEELRFSVKNPLGGSIDIGKVNFSAQVRFDIALKALNEQFECKVTASFYFLQDWKLSFKIKTPPLSDGDFIELLRKLLIEELLKKLSPDSFFSLLQSFTLESMLKALERLGVSPGSVGLKTKIQYPRSYVRLEPRELVFHLEGGVLNFDMGIRAEGNHVLISKALSFAGPAVAAAISAIAMLDRLFPWQTLDALGNLLTISGSLHGSIYSGAVFHLESSRLKVSAFKGVFKLNGEAKFDNDYMEIHGDYTVIDFPILKIGGKGFYAVKTSQGLPDISFGGTLNGSTGAFGFKTGAESKMQARHVISPDGILTVESKYSMIDTPLFQLAGKAKFTLLMNGKMSLHGSANAGTKYVKLAEAKVSAEDIGADTKITIAGNFHIDSGVLKVNGKISGTADAVRHFALSGKVEAVSGSLKVSPGKITLRNDFLEFRSNWLGHDLILSATNRLVLAGRLHFNFNVGVSLPGQSASASVAGFKASASVPGININPQVVCHIDVTIETSRFEAKVGGYINYYGRIGLGSFTIAASTSSLTDSINRMKDDIIKNKMSYFSGEISRMHGRAYQAAYHIAYNLYKDAMKSVSDGFG